MQSRTKILLVMALLFLNATIARAEPEYIAPSFDARLLVPIEPFTNALDQLAGLRYEGRLKVGSLVDCNLGLDLDRSDSKGKAAVDFDSGSTSFELFWTIHATLHRTGICKIVSPEIDCSTFVSFSEAAFPVSSDGGCLADFDLVRERLPVRVPLGPLLDVGEGIQVPLQKSFKAEGEEVALEYVDRVPGGYAQSATPYLRIVPIRAQFSGIGGQKRQVDESSRWLMDDVRWISVGMTVGTPHVARSNTIEAAFKFLESGVPGLATDRAVLEINSSLFYAQNSEGNSDGLFGSILPIKVSGQKKLTENLNLEYALVLSELWVGFSNLAKCGELGLKVVVDQPKLSIIRKETKVTESVAPKKIAVTACATAPKIAADGTIELEVTQFDIEIGFRAEGSEFTIVIPNLHEGISLGHLQLGKLNAEAEFSLPDCIEVEDEHFRPRRPCDVRTLPGAISKSTAGKNQKIIFRFDRVGLPEIREDNLGIRYFIPIETFEYD